MMQFRQRIASFKYAFRGLADVIRTQPNAQIHVVVSMLVITGGWYFSISRMEWIALVLTIGVVIALEAANTALEYLTDLVSPEYHPLAGKAKDAAAAAVLMAAAAAVVVGVIIFGPHIMALGY
ncbi:MAG: diacylglycerol kinase family protein [Saprospiraceae bacterium]|nr:diacylglycerol kinase family protein [Saprospiraceae bacterium]